MDACVICLVQIEPEHALLTDIETEIGGLPDEAKVFLSYSRKDRERAQGIADALRSRHFGVFKDTDDILPTEEWRDRLQQLIEEADTIVFLLSPHSATSEVCAWEVEYATSLNKRIAPIVIEDVEGDTIPPLLARLNFIFCTPRDPFENAVDTLASALNTDIDWIREHTRLAGLTQRWEKAGRHARLLLRGQDIADAEAWRDSRPKDAPEVTPAQAAFIAENRKAASRRQRNWIAGSLAVAASAVALAVFAYFQSVEADQQRLEAELQRGVAEENATEAERQRIAAEANAAEAERQRGVAVRKFVAQSLLAGNPAEAVRNLIDVEPEAPLVDALLAGLATPEEVGRRDITGVPLLLNGRYHFSREGAPPKQVLSRFPASRWLWLDNGVLLAAEDGALQRVGFDGRPLSQQEERLTETPCIGHRGDKGTTLISTWSRGLSACSLGLTTAYAPIGSGSIEFNELRSCEDERISLPGPNGAFERKLGWMIDTCLNPDRRKWMQENPEDYHPDLLTLRPLEPIAFPGPAEERTLWAGVGDPAAITDRQRERLARLGLPLRSFAVSAAPRGRAAPGWMLVDDFSTDEIVAAIAPVNVGGTGGGSAALCLGPGGANPYCALFSWSGGTIHGGTVASDGSRAAIYGEDVSSGDAGNAFSLWEMLPSGELTLKLPGAEIFSADYAPDGRLAALNSSEVLIVSPDRTDVTSALAPRGARAIAWMPGGDLILLSNDGVHRGSPGSGFAFTPLPAPQNAPHAPANGRPRPLWIAPTQDGSAVALGYGNTVVIYDTAFEAPITRPWHGPHPLPGYGASGVRLSRLEDGAFRISVAGERYERRAWGGGDFSAMFDPEAPFR